MNQKVCVRTIVFVLENTPNERISMTTILRYCEVTGYSSRPVWKMATSSAFSRPEKEKQVKTGVLAKSIPA